MSEIKNSRLRLYGAEHPKCNHMITPGFKGLSTVATNVRMCFITRRLAVRRSG